MTRCAVCGSAIADRGFQLVVPGVEVAFDRVECTERWRPELAAAPASDAAPTDVRAASPPREVVGAAPRLDPSPLLPAALSPRLLLRQLALPAVAIVATAGLSSAAAVLALQPESAQEAARVAPARGTPASAEPVLHGLVATAYAVPVSVDPRPSAKPPAKRPASQRGRGAGAAVPVALVRAATPASPVSSGSPPPSSLGGHGSPPAAAPTTPGRPPKPAPARPPQPPQAAPPPPAPPPPPPPAPPAPPPPAPPPATVVTAAPETRPGNGHGDKNHAHTGPPGQAKQDQPGKQHKP